MSYFNLRVYGLLINTQNQILISDEFEEGQYFSKFPGGGVEFGEGLIDALKREFMEECNVEIDVLEHFYTTDFYEKSSFNNSQVVSIYYLVKEKSRLALDFKTAPFDFDDKTSRLQQCFRWVSVADLKVGDITFKTDKTVVQLLRQKQGLCI